MLLHEFYGLSSGEFFKNIDLEFGSETSFKYLLFSLGRNQLLVVQVASAKPLLEQVYDVTEFMEDHPGGDEVLLSATGMELAEFF